MVVNAISNTTVVAPVMVANPIQATKQTTVESKINAFSVDKLEINTTPQDYEKILKWVEETTGRPIGYKTKEALNNYLKSMKGFPQEVYDPYDFLPAIGVTNAKSSGRGNDQHRAAVEKSDYTPHNTLWGKEIFVQKWFFTLSKKAPELYDAIAGPVNTALTIYAQKTRPWEKPYNGGILNVRNNSNPEAWKMYGNTEVAKQKIDGQDLKPINALFGDDFHAGIPDGTISHQLYGSYYMAKKLGFTDAQALRISKADFAIDENGKTTSSPIGAMDRHFNMNDIGHEDTRLIWATKHLNVAINLAQKGDFEQAEKELGFGLHSLQDLFAHGQVEPAIHATLGGFPDDVSYNPIAMAEATTATYGYLQTYLDRILGSKPN